jgi:hypothetical protein
MLGATEAGTGAREVELAAGVCSVQPVKASVKTRLEISMGSFIL